MSRDTRTTAPPAGGEPLYVPAEWGVATPAPARPGRDVALDLLRGLGMTILVVNHLRLASPLSEATRAVLSAAELLVGVSGVVVGMVFGRRWLVHGGRATAALLLRRSRKLYLASVVVVALVGAAKLVPWLATDALTVSSRSAPGDLYDFDGAARTVLAILTLEAGPWQFNILGFFIAVLALAPAVLWALARGWWPAVLAVSWALYAGGRAWGVEVLPSQSEWPFPLLVWQVLFVTGAVVGWHRDDIAALLGRRRRLTAVAVAGAGTAFAAFLIAGPRLVEEAAWAGWRAEHFDKDSLDLLRILALTSVAAALYLAFRRHARVSERFLGPLLLPLGRNSFYVFIMHVFVCLAVASVRLPLGGGDFGAAGNLLVQVGCLALLVTLVRRRVLFRWVPR